MKVGVIAAVIPIENKCVKLMLPNKCLVDILPEIFEEIKIWTQRYEKSPEAGGFIVGYQHKGTGNVSLENISCPYPQDVRSRFFFAMKDQRHNIFLLRAKRKNSYYMGVWHTHPQIIPEPSQIDWDDWNETLNMDKTACDYVFFAIAGIEVIRIWVGDLKTKKITEIFECKKEGDLYKKA